MAAADISRSAQHAAEALVRGTDANQTATPVPSGTFTATIPTAGANACTSVSVTLTGAVVGDIILVSGPTVALTGLAGVWATVVATDTVKLCGLGDGSGFTGASKTYNYVLFRQS